MTKAPAMKGKFVYLLHVFVMQIFLELVLSSDIMEINQEFIV